ncbi:MAG: import inner membrane translocase subunit [Beijerinckiaceae bacterium]|nr:MAG: import inner membrane translocase subunit [Beijerinckiaceae bacterium]
MNGSTRFGFHRAAFGMAIVSAFFLMMAGADARPGKASSAGSRGTRTDVAPPTTNTAPRQSQPITGSQTPRAGAPAPAAPAAQPSRWSGLMGGLAGGLIGAGLFGLLAGNGLFGGMGSLMSILGLILQIGIVFFIVRFAINYFRRNRAEPATAGGPANFARQPVQPEWQPAPSSPQAAAAPASTPVPAPMPPLDLVDADFGAFERLLGEIQEAYGKGDRISLTQRVTPEMANLFNGELSEMARQGVVNTISDVRLVQGDLAEAWREPDAEYATVAMRYTITDVKRDKATGRILEGDPNRPQDVVENWTFVRHPGGHEKDWILSAIQQA